MGLGDRSWQNEGMLIVVALSALFVALTAFTAWNIVQAPQGIETEDGFRQVRDE